MNVFVQRRGGRRRRRRRGVQQYLMRGV